MTDKNLTDELNTGYVEELIESLNVVKRVVREISPDIIDKLKDNFVQDGVYDTATMCADYKTCLRHAPDEICVLVGYEDDKIVGHLIAFVPLNRKYVLLDQAWHNAQSEHAVEGFRELENWVRSLGLNEIRFETERASVMARAMIKWGFRQHSVVFQKFLGNQND